MRSRASDLVLISALVILVSSVASSSPNLAVRAASSAVASAAFPSHAPIFIGGDADFTSANGVVAGTGTAVDPFIIEGWDINGSTQGYPSPIQVQDTRAYFTIQNVSVHDFAAADIFAGAIQLSNVSNARIEGVSVSNASIDLGLDGVSYLGVANSTFAGPGSVSASGVANSTFVGNVFGGGAWVGDSQDVTVRGNSFQASLRIADSLRIAVLSNGEIPGGIALTGATVNEVASHTITTDNLVGGLPIRYYANCAGTRVDGLPTGSLIVANCTGIRISNLSMAQPPFSSALSMILAYVRGADIADNWLNNSIDGIEVASSTNVTVERNTVENAWGIGILVEDTPAVVIQDNAIVGARSAGIMLMLAPGAAVLRNDIAPSPPGTSLYRYGLSAAGISALLADGSVFAENHLLNQWAGIMAGASDRMTFRANEFDGGVVGLDLYSATNATVAANRFHNVGLEVQALGGQRPTAADLTINVTADNLVNGLPLRFYHGCDGLTVDSLPTGQLIVEDCTNVVVRGLNVSGLLLGITLVRVDHATVEDNEVWGAAGPFASAGIEGGGIEVKWSSNVTVASNHVTNGIQSYLNSESTITGNNVSADLVGIWLLGGNRTTVSRNKVWGSAQGIQTLYTTNSTILENDFVDNSLGIYVAWAQDLRIYHNNFLNNTRGAAQLSSSNITWDDGYPSGGNYWSDYNGTDHCTGANQSDCTQSDGIGDTPYVIESDDGLVTDRYPLVTLYAAPQSSSTVSPYLILGIGWGIGGAIAVGAYLVWRQRRRPAPAGVPTLPPDATPPPSPK